ncbi:unnamed protein product [Caenorhabditis angaria]|uniref:BPTI/Kunitz inhibitor domain-containing protein n=1 Tax=Caenorhabditis angaria TaxID=860376 RepID=A0A9P1IUF8_9PELO|nr:unnamed protein product [Caenorhabditis angaria]
MISGLFIVGLLTISIGLSTAQFRGECEVPLHKGIQECKNTSSIRYHFDKTTQTCLAFRYSGCGGNTNNFKSHSECQQFCLPMDYFTCPVASAKIKSKDGSVNCAGMDQKECDGEHSYCVRGSFVGFCCDKRIRDKVNQDYDDECGPKQKKEKVQMSGYSIPLLGKTCDSNFCSTGYKCQQGNYYAYCCK